MKKMKKIIKKIKNIEKKSYPKYWQMMQDCHTIEDIASYCDSTIAGLRIFLAELGYCLISDSGEICDIAGKFKLKELFELKKFIWDNFNSVHMDCRADSQKLIRKLDGNIVEEYTYYEGKEKIKFFKINKKYIPEKREKRNV